MKLKPQSDNHKKILQEYEEELVRLRIYWKKKLQEERERVRSQMIEELQTDIQNMKDITKDPNGKEVLKDVQLLLSLKSEEKK